MKCEEILDRLNGSGMGPGAGFCELALNRVLRGCDTVWFLGLTLWRLIWRYIPPKRRYPRTLPRLETQSERSTQWGQTTLWTFGAARDLVRGIFFTSWMSVSFTRSYLVNGLYYCCLSVALSPCVTNRYSVGVVFDSTLNSSVVPTFPPDMT